MKEDWRLTVQQALPQALAVWRHLQPTYRLPSLAGLTVEHLRELGLRGVIWDVDGTLTAHHGTTVDPSVAQAWSSLSSAADLRHVILSNCGEDRFCELAAMFPHVPVVKGYSGPGGTVLRRRLGDVDTWLDTSTARESLVPLRKPSAELVRLAVQVLGCAPKEVVMIGDQCVTDVAGAGAAGVRSIKVPTLHRASFPAAVRLMQRLEPVLVWLAPRHRGE